MDYLLPAVPIDRFDDRIFEAILKIYTEVTKTEHFTTRKPKENLILIIDTLKNMSPVEFRLGSHLHDHSKLFLWPVYKQSKLYVGFSIDPNTSNDSAPRPRLMIFEFQRRAQKYINALQIE